MARYEEIVMATRCPTCRQTHRAYGPELQSPIHLSTKLAKQTYRDNQAPEESVCE